MLGRVCTHYSYFLIIFQLAQYSLSNSNAPLHGKIKDQFDKEYRLNARCTENALNQLDQSKRITAHGLRHTHGQYEVDRH